MAEPNTTPASMAIIVGGEARSGTTLMQRLLNHHHDIASFGETKLITWRVFRQFPAWLTRCPEAYKDDLLAVYQRLLLGRFYSHRVGHRVPRPLNLAWKAADRLWRVRFHRGQGQWKSNPLLAGLERLWLADAIQARTFWLRLPDDPEARHRLGMRGLYHFFSAQEVEEQLPLLQRLRTASSPEEAYRLYGDWIHGLYGARARRRGKRYWAEKTPPNCRQAWFYERCFPNLRLIHMVRDGRDVASSRLGKPWGGGSEVAGLDHWGNGLGAALEQMARLPAEHYLTVRYEDLVLNTAPTLQRVVDFLGLEWDDRMLGLPVYSSSVGLGRQKLSPQTQDYARQRWGPLLTQLGYEL